MPTKTFDLDATTTNGKSDGAAPPTRVAGAYDAAPPAVVRELHSFVADIEDLITATTSLTGEDLARAKARLAERVASAKHAVSQAGTAIAQGARRSAVATDEYVHASPWQAVGIGAAAGTVAGVLIGVMLARR